MDMEDDIFRRHLTECPYNSATQIYWDNNERPHQEEAFGYSCIHQSQVLAQKLCQGVLGMRAYLSNKTGMPDHSIHTAAVSTQWGRVKLYESTLVATRPINVTRMYEEQVAEIVGLHPVMSNRFLRCARYTGELTINVDLRLHLQEHYEPSERMYDFSLAEKLPQAEFGKVYGSKRFDTPQSVLRMHWLQENGALTSVQMNTIDGDMGIQNSNGVHIETALRSEDKRKFLSNACRIEDQRGIVRGGLVEFFEGAWELYKKAHPEWPNEKFWF